jgi:hypothetical protein
MSLFFVSASRPFNVCFASYFQPHLAQPGCKRRTVDIAMYCIEAGTTPGYFQLSEVLLATCLLQGSTRLDQQAEQLLLSLFDVHLRRLSVSSTIPAGVFQPGEGTLDTFEYTEAVARVGRYRT